MENFSIYRYMKLGIVHFKAFPEIVFGTGPIVETLRTIVEDDFWTAVEVGWIKDIKVRNEVRELLATSHMEVCYACLLYTSDAADDSKRVVGGGGGG